MFQKSGGLFPPATGLKPCSVGSRGHNAIGNCNPVVIKATKNGGSHPTVSFTPALVLMTKEKKSISKAGGQRYLAIKGHARPCLTYYIIDVSPSRVTLLPWKESNLLLLPRG